MQILKERIQFLKLHQTSAEKVLWQKLQGRKLLGRKFYRQYVIYPYIVDFVCHELKLIVELDGSLHMDNREQDITRTRYLEAQGYQVIRFWNKQVFDEKNEVLTTLNQAILQKERYKKNS